MASPGAPHSSERVHSAVRWKIFEQITNHGLTFVIGMVLARLLLPEEFGVFAMLALFTAIGHLFMEGGLAAALIQRQDITRADENAVFWFNLAVGTAVAATLVFAAPALARFFEADVLRGLAPLMGLNLLLSALLTVPLARLAKALDFRALTILSAASVITAGVVAVLLAWGGAGPYALAAQLLTTTIVQLLILLAWRSWFPSGGFDAGRFRLLFGFGSKVMLAGLVTAIGRQAHTVVIGRQYSAADLGFFSRALNTRQLPQALIATPFMRVSFPVFSTLAADPAALRRAFRRGLVACMALSVPAMVGIILVAENLVPVLFGPNWEPVIPLLQLLCISGIFWPMNMGNQNVLKAQGRAGLALKLTLFNQGLFLVAVVLAAQINLVAVAVAMVAAQLVWVRVNTWFAGRTLGYGLLAQLRDLAPYFALALVMALLVLVQRWLWTGDSNLGNVLVSSAVGALCYLGLAQLLRLEALSDGIALVRGGFADKPAA